MSDDRYAVKVRVAGKARFEFLTAHGSTTNLRIHAATWNEKGATEVAQHIVADNPEAVTAAKVVPL